MSAIPPRKKSIRKHKRIVWSKNVGTSKMKFDPIAYSLFFLAHCNKIDYQYQLKIKWNAIIHCQS